MLSDLRTHVHNSIAQLQSALETHNTILAALDAEEKAVAEKAAASPTIADVKAMIARLPE